MEGEKKEEGDWEGRRKEGGRAGGDTWEREREREREGRGRENVRWEGNEGGKKESMGGRRENRGRRKRREEGLERIAKSEETGRKQKEMGREGMERWKEEKKSYLRGKVLLDFPVLWR